MLWTRLLLSWSRGFIAEKNQAFAEAIVTFAHCPIERQFIPQKGYIEAAFGGYKRLVFC